MKIILISLLILASRATQVMAQNDPLTGAPCPIGGNSLVGNLIHDQQSSRTGYTPTTPFAPVIQPSPPPIVIPTITTPIVSPNAGYNNFGNNNYNNPYNRNYGYYNPYGNNPAAAGAGLATVGVAGFKVSKSILHKLTSSNHGNQKLKKQKITKLDNGNISLNGAEYKPVTEPNKPTTSIH